jgi:hypothetical protein
VADRQVSHGSATDRGVFVVGQRVRRHGASHPRANAERINGLLAFAEFSAFVWAGKHVEMLLGRFPSLTDWLAAHACR